LIESLKTGRNAGHIPFKLGRAFELFETPINDLLQALKPFPNLVLGNIKDRLLGLFEKFCGAFLILKAKFGDSRTLADQAPSNRQIPDDLSMVNNAGLG
jgi:hypothetical protein